MNELNTFYHGILSQLEFSITGYNDIDSELNKFFDTICESPVFIGRKHIDCISYAYAKLKNIDPFELESLTNNQFYFNSFNERSFELFLISDYYALKDELRNLLYNSDNVLEWIEPKKSETKAKENLDESISIKTSEIASKLFTNPTSYRIAATKKNHTAVKYEQHIDVITFELPFLSLFQGSKKDLSVEAIRDEIFATYGNLLLEQTEHKFTVVKNQNKYSFTNNGEKIKIEKFINKDGIKEVFKIIKMKLLLFNETNDNYFFGENPNEKVIDAFVKLIITHAFLSAVFDCWFENIPSIVQVKETKITETKTVKTKKCLGNIVVGYSLNQEIDANERIYLRLISDRISSNLAAIAMKNTLAKEKIAFHKLFMDKLEYSPKILFELIEKIKAEELDKTTITNDFKSNILKALGQLLKEANHSTVNANTSIELDGVSHSIEQIITGILEANHAEVISEIDLTISLRNEIVRLHKLLHHTPTGKTHRLGHFVGLFITEADWNHYQEFSSFKKVENLDKDLFTEYFQPLIKSIEEKNKDGLPKAIKKFEDGFPNTKINSTREFVSFQVGSSPIALFEGQHWDTITKIIKENFCKSAGRNESEFDAAIKIDCNKKTIAFAMQTDPLDVNTKPKIAASLNNSEAVQNKLSHLKLLVCGKYSSKLIFLNCNGTNEAIELAHLDSNAEWKTTAEYSDFTKGFHYILKFD